MCVCGGSSAAPPPHTQHSPAHTPSHKPQVYIIRTSGARLLALINDVMDAAALRQNRLVLAKGRVALRPLVGDVVDLTRSMVGASAFHGLGALLSCCVCVCVLGGQPSLTPYQ